MPTITVDRAYVESLIGKKIPEEKLQDRISMLGTDLQSLSKEEITVEIFPNRPDMLSAEGFARALSSFLGIKTGLRRFAVKKSNQKVIVDKSVTMRPYTSCAIVKNLKLSDQKLREIIQLQEKLATTHGRNRKKSAYGVYPLAPIAFPVAYLAKDPKSVEFIPLGFEKWMRASDIEKIHPKAKEYKHLTEGWKTYPFFIDSRGDVMSMLPYTNSNKMGKVELNTRDIFIECTGTDFENVQFALNIFCAAFADMGAEIYSLEIKYPDKTITTPNLEPKMMDLNIDYVNKILGLSLTEKEIKKLIEQMGYGYEKKKVLVPCYRADILHQVDLVEDIAIAYGFEHFKEEIPNVSTVAEESSLVMQKRKIKSLLIGLALLECNTYHLIGEERQERMNNKEEHVTLSNALTTEYALLRSGMLSSLIEVIRNNRQHEYPQKIFEMGTCFTRGKTETGVKEEEKLGIVLCGKDENFTTMKQILDYLFDHLPLSYEIKEIEHSSFIPGRVGSVFMHKKEIGIIGEIHPQVLEKQGLEFPVVALELNLSKLFGESNW